METEKLKQLVLAKGKEIAPTVGTHEIYAGIVVTNWPSGIRTIDRIPDGAAAHCGMQHSGLRRGRSS